MTTREPDFDTGAMDGRDTDAKLSLQRRQQLSALVDGDLAADQARFLLRRLGHDPELAGRWTRWQLIGDVLRGQPVAAMPAGVDGFPERVSAAVAADTVAPARGQRARWRHGIGVALAASVAAVALFVARPVSVEGDLPDVVASAGPAGSATPAAPPAAAVREVSVPQFAEAVPPEDPAPQATSVRIASTPALPPAGPAELPPPDPVVVATVDAPLETVLASSGDVLPFASPREPQARPWPRAVLPGLAGDAGGLTVGLDDAASPPSFYPFEPQLPADTEMTP